MHLHKRDCLQPKTIVISEEFQNSVALFLIYKSQPFEFQCRE